MAHSVVKLPLIVKANCNMSSSFHHSILELSTYLDILQVWYDIVNPRSLWAVVKCAPEFHIALRVQHVQS